MMATRGAFSQNSIELAGLGGDTQFVKWSTQHQVNLSLPLKSIGQWCLSAGAVWPFLQGKNQPIRINDRFFLGGPLNVRGFDYHGAGPHSDGEFGQLYLSQLISKVKVEMVRFCFLF